MLNLYNVTFTEDKGATHKSLTMPARTLTEAYIEVQLKLPDVDITEISDSERVLKIFDKRTGREI